MDIYVRTSVELEKADPAPGDTVILTPGIYTIDPKKPVRIYADGTTENHITYRALIPGSVRIEGFSETITPLIIVKGSFLHFIGIDFNGRCEVTPGIARYRPQLIHVMDSNYLWFTRCHMVHIHGYDDELQDVRGYAVRGRGDVIRITSSRNIWIEACEINPTYRVDRNQIVVDLLKGNGISLRHVDEFKISNCTFGDAGHAAVSIDNSSGSIYASTFHNRIGHGIAQWSGRCALTITHCEFFEAGVWPSQAQEMWAMRFAHVDRLCVMNCNVSPCKNALQLTAGDATKDLEMKSVVIYNSHLDGAVNIGRFIPKDGATTPQIRDLSLVNNYVKKLYIEGNGDFDAFKSLLYTYHEVLCESCIFGLFSTYVDRHTSTGYTDIGYTDKLNLLTGFTENKDK